MYRYDPEEEALDNKAITPEDYEEYIKLRSSEILSQESFARLDELRSKIENRGRSNTRRYPEDSDEDWRLSHLSDIYNMIQNGEMTEGKARAILDGIGREN